MSFIAVAIAIGGSAVLGAGASIYASDQQRKSANKATDLQGQQFAQTRADLAPWMQTGQQALQDIPSFLPGGSNAQPFDISKFHESPSYQFNLQQGQQALDKAANARGNYYAPQTLQDTAKFAQGMAGNEFNNAYNMYNQDQNNMFNRTYSVSGTGQNAASGIGAFGANFANNAGQNMIGAGNAQAAGIVGAGNAISGGIGQGYNAYLLNQILGQQQTGMYGGTAYSAPMANLYSNPSQNPADYVGLGP